MAVKSMTLKSNWQKLATAVVVTITSVAVSAGAASAALIDLAFSLDRSGSVGSSNYTNLVLPGLANALDNIPLAGPDQYRISVVSFSSSASTVVTPTILTNANLATVKASILADPFTGGTTCVSCSIDLLTTLVSGVGFGDSSLINISSDGVPNVGITNGTTVRTTAEAAGWDSISAEAIGNFNVSFLQALVSPNPGVTTTDPNALPDPLTQGFVLEVNSFADYGAAIDAKVQKIVNPPTTPEPSSLLSLLAIGGLTLAAKSKKQG
jgi:hypothetical protein